MSENSWFGGLFGSEDSEGPSWLKKNVLTWLKTPDPYKKKGRPEWEYEKFEKDNVWHEFHLFNNEWVEIVNRLEWYDAPHVPQIYESHKKICRELMEMERPFESFYKENVDSGGFESHMHVEEELPSENGEFRLEMVLETKNAPSGENDACLIEYFVKGKIRYDIPKGIDFLPRIIAYPLNRFFKYAYYKWIGEEQVEYDGEYAREKVTEYFQHIRKYHGEEPIQAKSRQAKFQPVVEDGVFFQ
jgi:hypothetical protein